MAGKVNSRRFSIRTWRGAILIGVVFLLVAIWMALQNRDPTYHGHGLSFWISELKTKGGMHEYLETKEALVHLGSVAAPRVALLLDYHEPKLLAAIRAKTPKPLRNLLPLQVLNPTMVKSRAFNILKEMGPEARTAVPVLIRLLDPPDALSRLEAMELLGSIGPPAESAVPALVSMLRSGGVDERMVAARSLGAIGSSAAKVIPAVLSAMEANRISWFIAVPALVELGHSPAEAVPLLIAQLRTSTNSFARVEAAKCLGLIGAPAAPAVPALIDALQDEESRIRARIAFALGKIGPNASNAVPALIHALEDEWWYVRENAAVALGRLQPTASSAIPALTRLAYGDPNQDVRKAALEAIRLTRPSPVESSGR